MCGLVLNLAPAVLRVWGSSVASWLNSNAGAVQALAAIGTLVLTSVLIGVTWKYVRLTSASLKLAREQFVREWQPDVRFALVGGSGPEGATIVVTNLGKPPAFLKLLHLQTMRDGKSHDIDNYRLGLQVPGANNGEVNFQSELGTYRKKYGSAQLERLPKEWDRMVAVSITYECAGQTLQSESLTFTVFFQGLFVSGIHLA